MRVLGGGDPDALNGYLDRLYAQFCNTSVSRPERLPYLYYSVFNVIAMYQKAGKTEGGLGEYNAEISIDELWGPIEARLREISHNLQKQREAIKPYEDIITYIDQHFADKDLCLSFLSAYFSVSEAYLSRIVKMTTGQGYMEYVEQKRMKRAEELLVGSACTMNEIADMVGYEYPNTFFKAFKRRYGVSPGTYRESVKM